MAGITAVRNNLPAGGGDFELDSLTVGIFLNDQPSHRLAVGSDKISDRPLQALQGWILPPGSSGLCLYDAPLDVMMVQIDAAVLEEVGMTQPQRATPIVGDLDPLTVQLVMSVPGFSQGGALYEETMHRALAAQLCNTLQQDLHPAQGIDDIRIRRAVEYIHDNLTADLTLESIASVAAMSGYHFSRVFKTVMGKSPLQYVLAERIALAQVLLKTTHLSIAEICYRSGYNDLSRFGQHFKRATGTTPARFRDN